MWWMGGLRCPDTLRVHDLFRALPDLENLIKLLREAKPFKGRTIQPLILSSCLKYIIIGDKMGKARLHSDHNS